MLHTHLSCNIYHHDSAMVWYNSMPTYMYMYLGNNALASSAVAGQRLASEAISNLWSFCFCRVLAKTGGEREGGTGERGGGWNGGTGGRVERGKGGEGGTGEQGEEGGMGGREGGWNGGKGEGGTGEQGGRVERGKGGREQGEGEREREKRGGSKV